MSDYTPEEVQAAWSILCASGARQVGGISRSVLGRMAGGSPPHEPTRYSDAEVRMARALIVMASNLIANGH